MIPLAIIGSIGMVAVESSYIPQIVRLARRRRSEDVSLLFPALNLLGRALALTYALSRGDSVFGVGLTVGILLRGILLVQVAWYRRFPRAIPVEA